MVQHQRQERPQKRRGKRKGKASLPLVCAERSCECVSDECESEDVGVVGVDGDESEGDDGDEAAMNAPQHH